MRSYKPPTFQERASVAAKAKQIAVDKHLARTSSVEEASKSPFSGRKGRGETKKKIQEEHRKRQLAEREARQQRAAELLELEAVLPELSDAEKRIARSARYTPRTRS